MEKSELEILDFIHREVKWGVDFSRYKAVLSGSVLEIYNYEKAVHFGGCLSRHKRVGKRSSKVRRAFSISRARLRIRRLISANSGAYGCRDVFVTFTFAENRLDLKTANKDWSDFILRLRYSLGFSPKYLAVVEFQKRGAIHYHAVFFNIPFILDIKVKWASIWGLGFIKINAVEHVRSLGAYLSKYLQKGVVDARLFNEKCYFVSRGLFKPVITRYPPIDNISLDHSFEGDYNLEQVQEFESLWTGRVIYKRYVKNVI